MAEERGSGPDIPLDPFSRVYGGRSAFASSTKPPLTRRYVPIVGSLRGYSGGRLRVDAVAGLTVAALALPSAMAYAELAGLPVTAGLYALLLPVLAYALLGSAPRVVVGPEGAVALLVASALAPLAAAGSSEYTALAAGLAVAVGVVFVLARLLRLGWIADYFSQSVLVGYITGVAILMILGQFEKLTGVSSDYDKAVQAAVDVVVHIGDANVATLVVGVVRVRRTRAVRAVPAALAGSIGRRGPLDSDVVAVGLAGAWRSGDWVDPQPVFRPSPVRT